MPTCSTKVLVVSVDSIGRRMGSTGIRSLEIAKQLAAHFDTTLFSPSIGDVVAADLCMQPTFHLATGDISVVYDLARSAEVVLLQPPALRIFPKLVPLSKFLVLDLYVPLLFELLTLAVSSGSDLAHRRSLFTYETALANADFSICASERQRDYWLGRYCARARLNSEMYVLDPTFRKLIDIVPFGLAAQPPERRGPGIRGVVPGIGADDFVLLWGGGIWNWLDPLTVIRAVGNLSGKFPQLKLYFMATKWPNPALPSTPMEEQAHALAAELGLINKHVFFGTAWVDYEERANILLDADVAISAHFANAETHLSFRTRLLDYLWAGLPTLTTCDDSLSELIAQAGAGEALPCQDVSAWSAAITRLILDPSLKEKYGANALNLAGRFHWEIVTKPLVEYCQSPYKLPRHKPARMPSIVERVHEAYDAGGYQLLLKRSLRFVKKHMWPGPH